jgi:Ser/Thr protein kinase RdoA (MazF antagonist)
MQRFPQIEAVISQYPADCQSHAVECLGNAGGFSGAMLWRVTATRGQLCLRRWPPESPDAARLQWLQAVVAHAAACGFRLLPADVATRSGRGFCTHDGHLWQLSTWMPGKADYLSSPRPEKLKAAGAALAQFHRAVEAFPLPSGHAVNYQPKSRHAPSPGIAERLALVCRLRDGALRDLRNAVRQNSAAMPSLVGRAAELLELISPHLVDLRRDLDEARRTMVPLQPCLRDIGHHHVLFEGERVSGIIDIGSMRLDCVATDLARLLGGLCGNDYEAWTLGLKAYESVRPLIGAEPQLVETFDRSQMMLAGIKWVEWVFVEGRAFSDPAAVLQRMEHILLRLRGAIA